MKLGYDCAVEHGVYVHHFRGKSLTSNNLNRAELLKVSNRILYDKWKEDIHSLIVAKIEQGEDVVSSIRIRDNSQYWLLHELNNDIGFIDRYDHAIT